MRRTPTTRCRCGRSTPRGGGQWSEAGRSTTSANAAPVFGQASYGFTLAENADGSGDTAEAVGTVSATDANAADTVRYSIRAGNTGNVFAIVGSGTNAGAITYTGGGENYESFVSPASAFTLTVRASDGVASTDVAVTVAVTDEDGEAPGRPAAPTFGTTTTNSVVVNWVAPSNAGPDITGYDVQYRKVMTPPPAWTDAGDTGTDTTTTIGSLEENTDYEVQVRAANAEGTSDWSLSGTTTTVDNLAPTWVTASPLTVDLAENRALVESLGTLRATDPDGDDGQLAYIIVTGNPGDDFSPWP